MGGLMWRLRAWSGEDASEMEQPCTQSQPHVILYTCNDTWFVLFSELCLRASHVTGSLVCGIAELPRPVRARELLNPIGSLTCAYHVLIMYLFIPNRESYIFVEIMAPLNRSHPWPSWVAAVHHWNRSSSS